MMYICLYILSPFNKCMHDMSIIFYINPNLIQNCKNDYYDVDQCEEYCVHITYQLTHHMPYNLKCYTFNLLLNFLLTFLFKQFIGSP